MNPDAKIATELIQRLPASVAREYRLVPFGERDGRLICYGAPQTGGCRPLEEAEVVTGERLEIVPVEEAVLLQLLNRHYRRGEAPGAGRSLAADGDRFLDRLIEEAFGSYASDIHFERYEERCRVRFRIDGRLIERYVIEPGQYPAMINQIKIRANLDISEKRLPQDGRIDYRAGGGERFDLRVSCLPTLYGEKVVLRLLTRHVELLELDNLGFSERQLRDYRQAIARPHGLVLITGPTGSGKSTTLYATLRQLNRETSNILTIEDPVEYTLPGINQVQLKEEIGLTFGSALRTFLRQDPDIIMLGEIRDADTAQMAIRSSLTGHLIFSTIHTNSAWGSVSRLIDMGMHPYLISGTLILCVAQRLLRLLCPDCKRELPWDGRAAGAAGALSGVSRHYGAVGCERCYYTGYKGRKAIYEVIPLDGELSAAVRRSQDDVAGELRRREIVTLRDSAIALFGDGLTSLEELIPLLNE
jgi:general secretion pathway protein E/type IV pilus assembly protein PilB